MDSRVGKTVIEGSLQGASWVQDWMSVLVQGQAAVWGCIWVAVPGIRAELQMGGRVEPRACDSIGLLGNGAEFWPSSSRGLCWDCNSGKMLSGSSTGPKACSNMELCLGSSTEQEGCP